MARHVRNGDLVFIRTGKHKGQTGRIIRVLPEDDKVIVQGMNMARKHVARSERHPQGGVIQKEMPIHISNVSPVVDGKPTRVRFETRADGSKVRLAVKDGSQLGPELKKARKK